MFFIRWACSLWFLVWEMFCILGCGIFSNAFFLYLLDDRVGSWSFFFNIMAIKWIDKYPMRKKFFLSTLNLVTFLVPCTFSVLFPILLVWLLVFFNSVFIVGPRENIPYDTSCFIRAQSLVIHIFFFFSKTQSFLLWNWISLVLYNTLHKTYLGGVGWDMKNEGTCLFHKLK